MTTQAPPPAPDEPCPCGSGLPYAECCLPLGRQTVQQTLQQALQLHRDNQLNEAEALYRTILEVAPKHPDALHLMGLIALEHGRARSATALIRRAVRANPGSARLFNSLGVALYAEGNYDAAAHNYRRALVLEPRHPDAHANLANALRAQGKQTEATHHLREALKTDPEHEDARQWLHQGMNRWQTAQFMAYRPNKAIHTALPGRYGYYSAAPLPAPAPPDDAAIAAQLQAALQLHRQEQMKDAEAAYRNILQQNPEHPDALHLLGLIAHQAGRHEEGAALMAHAVDVDDTRAAYHGNLASALMAAGRLEEAADFYRQAIALEPRLPEPYYNLGNLLKELGDIEGALANYELALWYRPDYAAAYFNLGQTLFEQGRTDEARENFERALELQPDLEEAVRVYLGGIANSGGAAAGV
jgi:protein O-GlcNAc transferase